jgi:hypothetical protein
LCSQRARAPPDFFQFDYNSGLPVLDNLLQPWHLRGLLPPGLIRYRDEEKRESV